MIDLITMSQTDSEAFRRLINGTLIELARDLDRAVETGIKDGSSSYGLSLLPQVYKSIATTPSESSDPCANYSVIATVADQKFCSLLYQFLEACAYRSRFSPCIVRLLCGDGISELTLLSALTLAEKDFIKSARDTRKSVPAFIKEALIFRIDHSDSDDAPMMVYWSFDGSKDFNYDVREVTDELVDYIQLPKQQGVMRRSIKVDRSLIEEKLRRCLDDERYKRCAAADRKNAIDGESNMPSDSPADEEEVDHE
jgi:hypothetical protein